MRRCSSSDTPSVMLPRGSTTQVIAAFPSSRAISQTGPPRERRSFGPLVRARAHVPPRRNIRFMTAERAFHGRDAIHNSAAQFSFLLAGSGPRTTGRLPSKRASRR
jgi:hypothetical protein